MEVNENRISDFLGSNINLLGYIVELPAVEELPKVQHQFHDADLLACREKAVTLAKGFKDEHHTYKGVKVTLQYLEKVEGKEKPVKKNLSILTGKRMPTPIILATLDTEGKVLNAAGVEFQFMETDFKDGDTSQSKTFKAINQFFVTLYYFTAS